VAETTVRQIAPADGKLGVLCVGLGAVATTFMAGVENVRRGAARPIGSVTQMGTIRLGKRTDKRAPLIREFVPLAALEDLVFGAWDPVPDDAYAAALHAGVLDKHEHIEPIAGFLKNIKPMPAVFDQAYVKRLEGKNVKPGSSKRDLAEALRKDIRDFKTKNKCSRLVMIWCASTEIFISPGPAHWTLEAFEKAVDANDPTIAPSMLYAYAAMMERVPFANGAPNLTCDFPAMEQLAKSKGVPIGGKDFKTGQTMIKTVLSPMFKARMLGVAGWYSTNILGNRDGEVLDDPEPSRRRKSRSSACWSTFFSRRSIPSCTATCTTRSGSTTTRRGATTRRAGTTSTSSGGWATRCRSRSIFSAAIQFWPRPWCSIWLSSSIFPSGRA